MKKFVLLLLATAAPATPPGPEATAEAFMAALFRQDGAALVALLDLPEGNAGRAELAHCLSDRSRVLGGDGRVLASRRRGENHVRVDVRVAGRDSDVELPLRATARGWRVQQRFSAELGCALPPALALDDPGAAAEAYLHNQVGVIYDEVSIDEVRTSGARAEVILSGRYHAVVPKPQPTPFRRQIELERGPDGWRVRDDNCAGDCPKALQP